MSLFLPPQPDTPDPTKLDKSSVIDNVDMSAASHTDTVSQYSAYSGDVAVYAAAHRKAWVTGVLKPDSFVYYTKATTSGGIVTFYITDDGTATGNAVYTNVYADSIMISPYGSSAVFQVSAPTVAVNKKSVSATINQVTSVVLGLIQISSAANGVDCRLLVLGD